MLGRLPQVADALKAVADENDPNTWALKLIVVASIGALGYLGKLMLERPRPAEIDRIKDLNRQLREKLQGEREERRQVEREMNELHMHCVELRMLLRSNGIDVPEKG